MGNIGNPVKIIEVEEVPVPDTVPAFEPGSAPAEPAPSEAPSEPTPVDEPVPA